MSRIVFHWGIVFVWDPNNTRPFQCHVLEDLRAIPENWIEFDLTNATRIQKLKMNALGDGHASLFAKVEYGK